jgi:predicted permease
MSWRRSWSRLKGLAGRRRIEAELEEEMRTHLEMEEDDNLARGMSPEGARRAARRSFGNPTAAREQARDVWLYRRLEIVLQDLRFALRVLRKTPAFTAVAVLTLALGIGANTAIFTLLDQLLLRLLPVEAPERLALLSTQGRHYGNNMGDHVISHPMFRDFQRDNQVFSGMFARRATQMNVSSGGRAERVAAELVSGTYFDVLGVGAALGRTFTPEDDRAPGGHPQVVLAHAYWQARFSADPGVLGKTLLVNGRSLTVVGVAAAGFEGLQLGHRTKLFVPIMMQEQVLFGLPGMLDDRRTRWVNAFGRLRPGVDLEQARAGLQPLMAAMLAREVREPAFSRADAETRADFLESWMDVLPGGQGQAAARRRLVTPLWSMMAAAGFVLLIACANLANLLLARSTTRRTEVAVRLALGAGRGRIVGQLLTESVLLSLLGGIAGLAVAYWGAQLLVRLYLAPDAGGLPVSPAPDARILLFALAVTFLTGVGFGLAPALRATRASLATAMKDQGRSVAGGPHTRLRNLLAATQVTISLVLLVGAGLFLQTLHNLRATGPGFSVTRLIGFRVDPSLSGYTTERAKQFYQRLTDELGALPGVQSVALASVRVLEDDRDAGVTIAGARSGERPRLAVPYLNDVSPGYFTTLGVPILAGRDFTRADWRQVPRLRDPQDPASEAIGTSPTVAIINDSFARRHFPGENPLGRHLGYGIDPGTATPMEIVGVVRDMKYRGLRDEKREQLFLPYLGSQVVRAMTVHLRAAGDPAALMTAAAAKVRALDPELPIFGMRSMEAHLDRVLANERMIADLSAAFGLLATLLAMMGLYGVLSYTVAGRTREIAVRLALGARRGDVIALVMRDVVVLVAAGLAGGIAAALALTRLVTSQLFGVDPHDPLTLALAAALLSLVACAAGYLPARRASRVEPMVALRSE